MLSEWLYLKMYFCYIYIYIYIKGKRMKNKVLLLACAVIVMMLCACQPLNVSSGDSDVVTVAFRVAGEGVSSKAISIGNPLYDSNVIYQYKAIPRFKAEKIVGETGDVWTDFPTVYTGSEFKMKFTKGPWTFYVRGVDRTDLTPLYKIATPLKVTLTAKTKEDIIFNMEEDPEGISIYNDTGEGYGTIVLNIAAQCNSNEGELVVNYKPVGSNNAETIVFAQPTVDGNKSYFVRSVNLASGNYQMQFTYHDQKRKTPMGPYLVKVIANKNTTITGRIAHESEFVTDFSGTSGAITKNYRATFDGTAVESLSLKPVINNKIEANNEIEQALKEAMEANNKLEAEQKAEAQPALEYKKALNNEEKALNLEEKAKEEKKILKVLGSINFNLETLKEEAVDPSLQKKIGIKRELICGNETFNLDTYRTGEENGILYYAIPEKLFQDIDEKHEREYSPEKEVTLRIEWSNGRNTVVAESEPITLLFIK